jgi:hypothetical protein
VFFLRRDRLEVSSFQVAASVREIPGNDSKIFHLQRVCHAPGRLQIAVYFRSRSHALNPESCPEFAVNLTIDFSRKKDRPTISASRSVHQVNSPRQLSIASA